VRILEQTSKNRHPYDRSLLSAAIPRNYSRQLEGRRRFAARERRNPVVRFFEEFFSRSFITVDFFLNISDYVLAICTNGGKFKQYCSAASWLHKTPRRPIGSDGT
jgi:hypothetical protein